MRLPSRLLLTLLSAGLYGLSFPPYGSDAVAWFALVPFLIALRGLPVGWTLLVAWLSGLMMAYAITDFLPSAVANYYGQGVPFGAFLFVSSVTVMCCLSHMAFAVWYRWPRRPTGVLAPFLVGAAWVVAEFVRGDLEGNPWGTVGYTQARVLPLVQIAEWTGVYGVSFLVVAMNAALADVTVATMERRSWRAPAASVGLVATLSVGTALFGFHRLGAIEAEPPGGVPIAIVQGNVDLGAQWREEFYGRNLREYLEATRESRGHSPAPEVVFWPENAVTFFLQDEPLHRYAIGLALSDVGAQLVTGGPHKESASPTRFHNSAFLLEPTGDVLARYDKQVLLPFAEYYPAWLSFFVRRRFDGVREFTAGEPTPPLPTAAGPAAVVTCNEGLFPRTVRERVDQGGGYIVNLANDAWLGVHKYSDRVLDIVAVRAIEHRQYVVRASSSGGSAIVAPSGRVLVQSEPFTAEVLHGSIAARTEPTPYRRWGDAFVTLCALCVGLASAGSARRL